MPISDWKKLKGFKQATRRAIANFLQDDKLRKAILEARVVSVNSATELSKGIKKAGSNLSIYLGHSNYRNRNGDINMLGLSPGRDKKPLTAAGLSRSLHKKAPTPILVTCYGGKLELERGGKKEKAIGPGNRLIHEWRANLDKKGKKLVKEGKKANETHIEVKSFHFYIVSETPEN